MYQIRRLVELVVATVAIFIILRSSNWRDHMFILGLAVLSYKLADIVIQLLWHILPKRVLPTLHDKAVLITGCDTGFGNKLARELDIKGVTVFAGCLFAEGSGAKELIKDCSDRLKILQLDVTNDEHVKDAVKRVSENLEDKKLWAVVNNAAIANWGEAEFASMESVAKHVDVNTLGSIRVTQAFLPLLRRSKGRVVFMCSILAHSVTTLSPVYAMTKAALKSYAEGLRREMIRWSVTVHTIDPLGYVTALTNLDRIEKYCTETWNALPEALRSDYGGNTFQESMMNYTKTSMKLCRPESKIHEVVECMIDATIGENPKMQYFTGFAGQITGWFLTNLPVEIFDLIAHYVLPDSIRKLAARKLD